MPSILRNIKTFLFDMDGTIYLGGNILPGAIETLEVLEKRGIKYFFLTNNSSRSSAYYVQKLAKMGIKTREENIIISTHSLITYLKTAGGKKLFVLGTDDLKNHLKDAGYKIVDDETPDYVVVGFDTGLNYQNLSKATQYVDAGVPYVASHPDVRCPVEGGRFIPDCGSILALIKTATGKECTMITGKPGRHMVQTVLDLTGQDPSELAVVGDRLYTDIALGKNSGITSVLVLSGETCFDDIEKSPYKPDLVLNGIYELERNLL